MEKAHSRINWENYPSIATPLNEKNLNKMDQALDEVDNRVLGLDTAKLDKETANTMVKDVSFVEGTGIFTITLLNGTTKTFDTKLEKIATNFRYDYEKQKLIIELADGTRQEVDLSTLISNYEFLDNDIIAFNVNSNGKVTANVKDGTVTENKLQPNFLADVKTEVAKAKTHADGSYDNAVISSNASKEAKTYRDEAKQYRDETQALSNIGIATTEVAGLVKPDGTTIRVDEDGTIHADSGTVDYTELENKPTINGVEITGDLTTEDLNIDLGTVDYNELENKPSINDIELSNNKTLDELGIASKTKVEEIETELAETNMKLDTIIELGDLGIKETASGEAIHLTDSADGKAVEYALYGKATQDGTPSPENPVDILVAGESYNIIPYPYANTTITQSGITWTDNGDGTIVASGKATSTSFFTLCNIGADVAGDVFKPNTRYILSIELKNAKNISMYVNANGGDIAKIANKTEGYYEIEFTTPSSYTNKFTVAFYRNADGNTEENCIIKPMIRKASVPNNRHMPYGVGSVEVKSCGKNLLKNNATTQTKYGLTFTSNKDGVLVNGTSEATPIGLSINTELANCLKTGKEYVISGVPNNPNCYIQVKTKTDATVVELKANEIKSFVQDGTVSEVRLVTRNSGVTFSNVAFKPMIRLATDTDATYEPYKGKTATISTPNGLAGIKVDSGGNYTDQNGQQWICDEVVKYDDGSGALIQRVGKETYENVAWENRNIAPPFGVYTYCWSTSKKNIPSNYNNPANGSEPILTSMGDKLYAGKNYLNIETNMTLEEFSNYMSSKALIVCYKLPEPITTPLTAEQLADIETFYPVTNISNDFDCEMKVKYKVDAKNYIDSKLSQIATAMINNI